MFLVNELGAHAVHIKKISFLACQKAFFLIKRLIIKRSVHMNINELQSLVIPKKGH
ncbi:hypothetical protein CLAVI_000775 [Candidatus Clavichlamydia salmonicola]|nr:hypothetical protein [Candidatus Clavichlamydia salmonicola]